MKVTASAKQELVQSLDWAEQKLSSSGVPSPRVDAEYLLAASLGLRRTDLYLHPRPFKDPERKRFEDGVERRSCREPLQYILGETSFFGRSFSVNRDVLIPRPETELLIEECLKRTDRPKRVLDVGTGSGCIAVTLACEFEETQIVAVDVQEKALTVAKTNARNHHVSDQICFYCGDLTEALGGHDVFDLIVANLPYIAKSEFDQLQREVRDFEPLTALDGRADGLFFIDRLIHDTPRLLRPGSLLALEIGHDQAEKVASTIEETDSFETVEVVKDLAGYERMLFAVKI